MLTKEEVRELYKNTKFGNEEFVVAPVFDINGVCGSYKIIDNRELVVKSDLQVSIPEIISKTEMVYKNNGEIFVPELIFVPCRALDSYGNRVGSGYGYFDRYLQNKNVIKVGVVREIFLYDKIENQPHDIKMDYILSEKRFIKIQAFSLFVFSLFYQLFYLGLPFPPNLHIR
ncbi:MAG: hypothetical protein Ta2D_07380 [Rickettsiales bacterium]|nr:MAG: hypothetical protein Ta2D_07380 [Rickettsiales bacterium]